MTRDTLEQYIADCYGVRADYPWESTTDAVFRHPHNRKWFALLMTIPASRLGQSDERLIDVMNVKGDPTVIGSLLSDDGIYPAYHMNKEHWISVALDRADESTVRWVLDESFALTAR